MSLSPHGGYLINSFLPETLIESTLAEIDIDAFTLADLECIAIGAYSPLKGFMTRNDYESVRDSMRLENGLVWTLPITLPIDPAKKQLLHIGDQAKLVYQGCVYGLIEIDDIYEVDLTKEAQCIYGTTDLHHPGVQRLHDKSNLYVGGNIRMTMLPQRIIANTYYIEPAKTRQFFKQKGWETIVAFQTRNPIHRAHEYIQKAALEMVDGLLIHPLVGQTKKDDIPASTRMKSYEAIIKHYFSDKYTMIAAFPAPMRYAGPREAIFHALVRKNYGCTHFIVGRDHAGVGSYYGPYDAQKIFNNFTKEEIGITPLFFENSFYCTKCENMGTTKTCPHDESNHINLSGTKVRSMLAKGERPPVTFSRPEVIDLLLEGGKQDG